MKQVITFAMLVLALLGSTPCSAEKTEAKKFPAERVVRETAVYIETLKLKGDDAEKFTKLYIEYRRKIHNALEKNRTPYKCDSQSGKLTNEQIDRNIRAKFASSKEILAIREQYYPKFIKIITPSQYEQLNKLEQRVFEKSRNEHQRRKTNRSTSTVTSKSKSQARKKVKTSFDNKSNKLVYGSFMTVNFSSNNQLNPTHLAKLKQIDGKLKQIDMKLKRLDKLKRLHNMKIGPIYQTGNEIYQTIDND
ncbi:MAG: hypothetical protein K2K88_00080 [Muribaculaceae bacterium]|nr:hypothetical protein [Muribaculaceae bacterium]MDE6644280.1 hypothetical protein [Muribaculaceae bacterium]